MAEDIMIELFTGRNPTHNKISAEFGEINGIFRIFIQKVHNLFTSI
jgi:hypothetical protein